MKKLFSYLSLPVVIAAMMSGNAFADHGAVKVGGFVDAQARWGGAGAQQTGVSVWDGAVYLSGEMGMAKFMVDLPFTFGAGTNNLVLGGNRGGAATGATGSAQAYVTVSYDNGLHWSLGQWDTPFGVEAQDSTNLNYFQRGLLANTLPTTHAGLKVGYAGDGSPVHVDFFISNPRTASARAAGTNFEYGLVIGYEQDMKAQLGAMLNKVGANTAYLIDIVLGGKFDALSVDLGVDFADWGNTPKGTGFGIAADIVYAVSDMMDFGLRGEFLSKLGGTAAAPTSGAGNAAHSSIGITVGPTLKLNDHVRARVNYQLASVKATSGGSSTTTHQGAVSALFDF